MNLSSFRFTNLGPHALLPSHKPVRGAATLSDTSRQSNQFILPTAAWLDIQLYMANLDQLSNLLMFDHEMGANATRAHRIAQSWQLTFPSIHSLVTEIVDIGRSSSHMYHEIIGQLTSNAIASGSSKAVAGNAQAAASLGMRSSELYHRIDTLLEACGDVCTALNTQAHDLIGRLQAGEFGDVTIDDFNQLVAAQARLEEHNQRYHAYVMAAGASPTYTWASAVGWVAGGIGTGAYAALAKQEQDAAAQAAKEIADIQIYLPDALGLGSRLGRTTAAMTAQLAAIKPAFEFMHGVWSSIASDLAALAETIKGSIDPDLVIDLTSDLTISANEWDRIAADASAFLSAVDVSFTNNRRPTLGA
jgi:hypothetical protein